jgi:hypothetical protein
MSLVTLPLLLLLLRDGDSRSLYGYPIPHMHRMLWIRHGDAVLIEGQLDLFPQLELYCLYIRALDPHAHGKMYAARCKIGDANHRGRFLQHEGMCGNQSVQELFEASITASATLCPLV